MSKENLKIAPKHAEHIKEYYYLSLFWKASGKPYLSHGTMDSILNGTLTYINYRIVELYIK